MLLAGAMLGTGQVLPIGGLKEKSLAAQGNGVRIVIAPAENEVNAEDVPDHLRKRLEFHFVRDVDEVLAVALRSRPRTRRVAA